MKAREVARAVETMAPLHSGVPGDELGFVHGDPGTTVSGVGCAWCADAQCLRYCIRHGLNTLVCHESLWVEPQVSPWYIGPAAEPASNRIRRELLERGKIVVYRSHSNWDALRDNGVADAAVNALALPIAREVGRQAYFSVQELNFAMTAGALKRHVAARLGYRHCRLFGDGRRRIRTFAFLIGGFGENQLHMPQSAVEMGAELILLGEMSEFVVLSCLEMGVPVIETLHSVSEMPGIRRQARLLARRLPQITVRYVDSGASAWGDADSENYMI